MIQQLPPLEFVRLCCRYRSTCFGSLPAHAGKIIRSCLARAFHDAVCVTQLPSCDACEVRNTCPYHQVFSTSPAAESVFYGKYMNYPHPYIIQPPLGKTILEPGQSFEYRLIVLKPMFPYLSQLIQAVRQAGLNGFGRQRIKMMLADISDAAWRTLNGSNVAIHEEYTEYVHPPAPQVLDILVSQLLPTRDVFYVRLEFLSPLRLIHEGRLCNRFDFTVFIETILRRLSMLAEMQNLPAWSPDFETFRDVAFHTMIIEDNTYWFEMSRYSRARRRVHKMGGLLGDVVIYGEPMNALLPVLMAASLLHAGKLTAFGHGRVELFYI